MPKDVEVVAGVNPPKDWPSTTFEDFVAKPAGPEVDAAHAKVGPDTVAKLLFTSGSTGTPKGVINTQQMMTSNQAMLKGVNPSYHMVAPVLVDWLPWSHTFGGNNNFNLVLSAGGSYYIDEGRPLPGAIEATVRNLKDVSPTVYYNVPKGFEMLLPYVEQDADLRKSLFAHLQAFVYAGAALAPVRARGVRAAGPRDGRPCRADPDLARLDRDRARRRSASPRRPARRASSASRTPASRSSSCRTATSSRRG